MAPCRSTRIVRDRAKSCPCNRTTMRSIARAPKHRRFRVRSGRIPCLRARRDLSNVCYVDVRAVRWHARLSCRQRHPGRHHFRCMAPCRSMRLVRDRAESCPCNRTTMHFIARAPKNRRFRLRSRRVLCLRARRDLSNVCCAEDVWAVCWHVSLVVSGIWADTVSDA